MAVKFKTGYVHSKELRRCKFYAAHLYNRLQLQVPIQAQTAAEYCVIINSTLSELDRRGIDRQSFISEMEQACSSQILPEHSFDWFKNNDRMVFWVWGTVRRASNIDLGLPSPVVPTPYLYQQMFVNKEASNTQERYERVVEFFDCWSQHHNIKVDYLNRLQSEWGAINESPRPLKWLKEDDEQCRWASAYSEKIKIQEFQFKPVNTKELFLSVIATFDLWQAPSDSKKLFLININKAWSQKKHRDTLVGKKSLNTYLKEGTKQKLNELSELRGRKIHEILEELITQEYERLR